MDVQERVTQMINEGASDQEILEELQDSPEDAIALVRYLLCGNFTEIGLNDMRIYDLGNTITVAGVIYGGPDRLYICMLPDEEADREFVILNLDLKDWKRVIRQTDLVETQVLMRDDDEVGGIVKGLVRRSTRQIDQREVWKTFRRDEFKCRYCGNASVPMTVDHLVLWENGGPSTAENLVCCCRRCNKTRGNTEYRDWLNTKYYQRVSKGILASTRARNLSILTTLDSIPVRLHQRSR